MNSERQEADCPATPGEEQTAKATGAQRLLRFSMAIVGGFLGIMLLLLVVGLATSTEQEVLTAESEQNVGPGSASNAMPPQKAPPACSFMKGDTRFRVGSWKDGIGDFDANSWGCLSHYVDLPPRKSGLMNNIAYYVTGTATEGKVAKLVVNVNVAGTAKNVLGELERAAQLLVGMAFDQKLPKSVSKSIRRGTVAESQIEGHRIWTERVEFEPRAKGKFSLKLYVSLDDAD